MSRPCQHPDLEVEHELAVVSSTPLGAPFAWVLSLRVVCAHCGRRFGWLAPRDDTPLRVELPREPRVVGGAATLSVGVVPAPVLGVSDGK